MKRKKTRHINRDKHREQWTLHITKTFNDTTYGSKKASLEATTIMRNKIYQIITRELERIQKPYIKENVNYKEVMSHGKLFRYWVAWYYSNGERKQKYFNIDKLGDDKARDLAIKKASIARRWDKVETYYIEDKI